MSRSTACATAVRADGKRKKQIRRRMAPRHRGFPPAWELGKSKVFTVWTSDHCCISCEPSEFTQIKMNLRLQKVVIDFCSIRVTCAGPGVAGLYAAFTERAVKAVRCNGLELLSVTCKDLRSIPSDLGEEEEWKDEENEE